MPARCARLTDICIPRQAFETPQVKSKLNAIIHRDRIIQRKIVYVTDGLSPWVIGGMPTVARRHVAWLVDAGCDVTVAHGMARDVHIAEVDMIRIPWPHSAYPGKLNPWKYANELRRFSRAVSAVIDRLSPALVYAEGPLLADYLARPRVARAPVVFHPHGLEMFQDMGSRVLNLRARPLRALTRQHAAQSDRVVTQGGQLTRILADDLGVTHERMAYVPNCLPRDFPAAAAARAAQRRRYLFVGRPVWRKGLRLLLGAFRRLAPGATLNVVGAGRGGMRQQGNVIFHGAVREKPVMVDLFDRCDFLVVPSFSEGMATVILEAFGRALPVIATDVGATRELVAPEKTGWLIQPGDRDALGRALRAAGDLDDEAYAAMSRAALHVATGEFSPEQVGARFLAVIAALLDDTPRQAQKGRAR